MVHIIFMSLEADRDTIQQDVINPPESDLERYERVLAEHIFPELERGRPNWDRPHTISVVAKAIIANSRDIPVDAAVIIIAAYAHDRGYADLFEGGRPASLDRIKQEKPLHMQIGARKLEELLKDEAFSTLTPEQKARAVHLVSVHDRTEELTGNDERILMEADTLGAIDINGVKPTFKQAENAKYLAKTRTNRLAFFLTPYAKEEFERLVKEREEYYAALPPEEDNK